MNSMSSKVTLLVAAVMGPWVLMRMRVRPLSPLMWIGLVKLPRVSHV